jgi:hypothetical protein
LIGADAVCAVEPGKNLMLRRVSCQILSGEPGILLCGEKANSGSCRMNRKGIWVNLEAVNGRIRILISR